jgi:hypothetical protein
VRADYYYLRIGECWRFPTSPHEAKDMSSEMTDISWANMMNELPCHTHIPEGKLNCGQMGRDKVGSWTPASCAAVHAYLTATHSLQHCARLNAQRPSTVPATKSSRPCTGPSQQSRRLPARRYIYAASRLRFSCFARVRLLVFLGSLFAERAGRDESFKTILFAQAALSTLLIHTPSLTFLSCRLGESFLRRPADALDSNLWTKITVTLPEITHRTPMARASYNSQRLALSAVEPAVALLSQPLEAIHGQMIMEAASRALTMLLLPTYTSDAATAGDVYIDDIGQLCVLLTRNACPLVIWPIARGMTATDMPQPTSLPVPAPMLAPGPAWRTERHARMQQATRTRLLVRSLVLQAAVDLDTAAACAPAKGARPKLALKIPEGTSAAEIIRTAVPFELPRRASGSSLASDVPSLSSGFTASTATSPSRWSMDGSSPHDGRSTVPGLSPPASASYSPYSPLDLGDFTIVADGRSTQCIVTASATLVAPPARSDTLKPPSGWLRQHSLRWTNVLDQSRK